MNIGPMLNIYPDSLGGTLDDVVDFLKTKEAEGAFSFCYILPSLYHTDLDRGFSVIDYSLNRMYASGGTLEKIKKLGIELKLDFILNHASVLSKQFQDIVAKGEESEYKDFFINWNKFWKGCGEMTEQGYILPEEKYLEKMFFRKPGLPILMVRFPDGREIPYWNTFYQEEHYPQYLGQMDLDIRSAKVWDFYRETLAKIASYGASIVRLDAFAYAPKAPGRKNFLNEPETWDLLEQIRMYAEPYELTLLPEIHAAYEEHIYQTVAEKGYMTYDFFLPGLVIDAIENKRSKYLAAWAKELVEKKINTVNMLGCHDGIPMLDLKGILPEEDIQKLIALIVDRGGMVKNLHGQKNVYYQVNATYFSALGESEQKLLLARAIQIFMPGKPQVWYLDLFAGKNDHEAVKEAGEGGHKEINRTNLTDIQIRQALQTDVVQKQLELLRFRSTSRAFTEDADIQIQSDGRKLMIRWSNSAAAAQLDVDFETGSFVIS